MIHINTPDCSCKPEVIYVAKDGAKVYVHHDIDEPPIDIIAEAIARAEFGEEENVSPAPCGI